MLSNGGLRAGPQVPGPQGIQGVQGPQGIQGVSGSQGTSGADGKTIHYDVGAPGSGVGVDGDFYIATDTNFIYGPKSTTWPAGVSLVGPQGTQGVQGVQGAGGAAGGVGAAGADGKTVRYGTGAPDVSLGVDGDFYVATDTHYIFGPKATTWPTGTSLVGPAGSNGTNGDDGQTVRYGTGAPGSELGNDGDFYIATDTHYVYGPKATTWPTGVSLVGPTGTAGAGGAVGAAGSGVAPGGATGQVLAKINGTDYNTQWVAPFPMTAPGDLIIDKVGTGGGFNEATAARGASFSSNASYRLDNVGYAFDGDDATYCLMYCYDVIHDSDTWLRVDLGTAKPIGALRVFQGPNYIGDWVVEYSTNNASWTSAFEGTSHVDSGVVTITPVTARYWRVRAVSGPSNNNFWNIVSFEVWSVNLAPTALPIGTTGQVLSVVDGLPAWEDASSGGGGHTIEDETTPLTSRSKLSFQGAGVTVTDDSGDDRTVVTIPGGGGLAMANPMIANGDLLYEATEPIVNVALATSGATASASAFSQANPPGLAIDGSDTTFWSSGNWTGSGDGAWLQVDLGTSLLITSYRVDWYPSYGASLWKLQYSTDSTTWLDAVTSSTTDDTGLLNLSAAITARYWRVLAVTCQNSPYVDIKTFDLWSPPDAAPTRLPIGATGQVLGVANGLPAWATPASGTDILAMQVFS